MSRLGIWWLIYRKGRLFLKQFYCIEKMKKLEFMRNFMLLIVLVISLSIPTNLLSQGTYDPNQIIIDFADDVLQADIDEYLDLINGTIIDQIDDGVFLVEIESFPIEYTDINGEEVVFYNVVDIIERDQNNADIDHSNLNFSISNLPLTFEELIESLPIDSYSPIPGFIDEYPGVLSCPNISMNRKVKVGIIDTGVDHGHSFITDYIVFEANIINDQFSAIDDHGHGTSVAGIIAGLAKSAGISSENLELYIIKALDENGVGSYFNMVKAVELANQLGLDILNLSWGFRYDLDLSEMPSLGGAVSSQLFEYTSSKLKESIEFIPSRLNICGAGNDGILFSGFNNNYNFHYGPADFPISNKITVGALNQFNEIAEFSNFGVPIHIFAPGTDILAPTLNGFWVSSNSGTSFSAAIITGVAVQFLINANYGLNEEVIEGQLSIINEYPLIEEIINNSANIGIYYVPKKRGYMALNINAVDISSSCNENSTLMSSFSLSPQKLDFQDSNKKEGIDENSIRLSPNPFSNNIEINFLNLERGKGTISIMNWQGLKVFSEDLFISTSGNDYFRNLNLTNLNLPNGTYLLRLQQNDKLFTQRIIKN
jgi:hypothetical protein